MTKRPLFAAFAAVSALSLLLSVVRAVKLFEYIS